MKMLDNIKKRIEGTIATNKNEMYNSSLYWSQKSFNITDILIEELTKENDIVLDPFMGSGVTIVEAIRLKRKAIGFDINDFPIFIAKTLLGNHQIELLKDKIELFFIEFKEKNRLNYTTLCEKCNEEVEIAKVIFDVDEITKESILKRLEYKCKCGQKIKKPSIEDNNKYRRRLKREELSLIENSRLAVKKGQVLSDIFSPRNYNTIEKYIESLKEVSDDEVREALVYILISSMHLIKITDLKSSSQWPLWTPKKDCVEKNAIEILEKRKKMFFDFINFKKEKFDFETTIGDQFDKNFENKSGLIIKKGAQYITEEIPKEFVDLIITDPPYLDQVLYSEYCQLYKSIPGFEINYKDEIVISNGKGRNKGEEEYYLLLEKAIEESSKVLKKDKYFCLYFHDTSLKVWNKVIRMMSKNNLEFKFMSHIKKNKKTLKKIIDPKKSLNGDALLVFVKTENYYEVYENNLNNKTKTIPEIEKEIIKMVKELIENNNFQGISTAEIYDNGILEYLINNGILEIVSNKYKDLTSILNEYFYWNSEPGLWEYIRKKQVKDAVY